MLRLDIKDGDSLTVLYARASVLLMIPALVALYIIIVVVTFLL